jgi:hypothetical protein
MTESDSIVVMESGADWPAWVDQEAGAVSNVVILARQPGESIEEFGERARGRIESQAALSSPGRGVLVLSGGSSPNLRRCRSQIARALMEVVRRAGGGDVVLAGSEDLELALELDGYARRLNVRGGGSVILRFRSEPRARTDGSRRVA